MSGLAKDLDDGPPILSEGVDLQIAESLRTELAAIVLLSGAVRATQLNAAVGRSIIDLPVDVSTTILDFWHRQARKVGQGLRMPQVPVRVMINRDSHRPTIHGSENGVDMQIEEDVGEFRGTAGVLRDLSADYSDGDLLLVANGAQIMLEPLLDLALELASTQADVAVVANEDRTPSGVMLMRCRAIRGVSEIGYVDMKEQALPRIARDHEVAVVKHTEPSGLPVRTLSDYINAVRLYVGHQQGDTHESDPYSDPYKESWRPTFGIIEEGAEVENDVRLHDSVVLRGGRVQRGAILIQSIVCPGGTVRRNDMVIDRLVEGSH